MNGYFLMLEWKPRNGFLTKGQLLMFQRITASSPRGQALVIYGDPGLPAELEVYQRGKRQFRQACDLAFLRWFCEQWGVVAAERRAA